MESEDPVAQRYETPTAATLAITVFSLTLLGLFVAAAVAAESFWEFWGVVLWPACLLWMNLCVLVPNKKTVQRRLCTGLGSLALFVLPRTDLCRKGPGVIIGGGGRAATIMVTSRALQLLGRLEASERSEGDPSGAWGRWRRFYHMACLSWHDVDRVKALEYAEHKSHYCSVLWDLMLAVIGSVVCGVALHFLPGAAALIGWAACMSLVCCFGAGSVICGFYTVDRAYLFLQSYFNQLGVQSIMGPGLWQSRTVKDFWRQWDLPVQRMLAQGVFRPLRKFGISTGLAVFAVFLVSGLGHTWPLMCVGAGGKQVAMMLMFFVSQIIPMKLESFLHIESRGWVYAVELLLSPLFVLPLLQLGDARLQ
eukprot:Skav202608  [mRNA]  locus=scaffold2348:169098:170192:+ [translate_table: standard]